MNGCNLKLTCEAYRHDSLDCNLHYHECPVYIFTNKILAWKEQDRRMTKPPLENIGDISTYDDLHFGARPREGGEA